MKTEQKRFTNPNNDLDMPLATLEPNMDGPWWSWLKEKNNPK